MYFRNGILCAAVTVGIAGPYLLIALQEHIVNAPGVNRQACNVGVSQKCLTDALHNMLKKCHHIPNQVTILGLHPVGEAVNLGSHNGAVFLPTHNVAAGGCADINRKTIFHPIALLSHNTNILL